MHSVSSKIFASVADDGLPVVTLQDYRQISPDFYSAVFSTIPNRARNHTFEEFNTVVASMSETKLNIEPESLFISAKHPNLIMRCILSANTESKPYEGDASVKGMIPIQANVFQDGETIWKLVGEGDERQLVQVTKEDYKSILDARRSRSTMTASIDDPTMIAHYEDGDFAFFINPELQAMDFGIVVKSKNSDFVFSRTAKKAVKVIPSQIVEAAVNEDRPQNKRREMNASNQPVSSYLEFLGQLYTRNHDYYRMLENAIKESEARVR